MPYVDPFAISSKSSTPTTNAVKLSLSAVIVPTAISAAVIVFATILFATIECFAICVSPSSIISTPELVTNIASESVLVFGAAFVKTILVSSIAVSSESVTDNVNFEIVYVCEV